MGCRVSVEGLGKKLVVGLECSGGGGRYNLGLTIATKLPEFVGVFVRWRRSQGR